MTDKTIAICTLGCKVNQYDSEAMLERFMSAGYSPVSFEEKADVYIINTCVVTQTGEKKSLQMIRRAQKINPLSEVIITGCLAQRDADELLHKTGARLVIGAARRSEAVQLFEEAMETEAQISAVTDVRSLPYEPLEIDGHQGHTRAVLKIQEGCDRFCTYCIIPYVRGGLRSRPPQDIAREAARLVAAGYQEIVLTGIHLTSYGRDLQGVGLIDAIKATVHADHPCRIRLGSLEPLVITPEFAQQLAMIPGLCPQFHLALQSGSDSVLHRMRRRYTTEQFKRAVTVLREYFPLCAITTDMICGFPGETEEEHEQSLAFCREIAFARMHVFPFSKRSGTPAAAMSGQLSKATKEERSRAMIELGEDMARQYAQSLLNTCQEVLFETPIPGGAEGYTGQYMRVCAQGVQADQVRKVRLVAFENDAFTATLCEDRTMKEKRD